MGIHILTFEILLNLYITETKKQKMTYEEPIVNKVKEGIDKIEEYNQIFIFRCGPTRRMVNRNDRSAKSD